MRDRGLRERALVEIGASSACLNGDTFVRAASHGSKTDLSAPTFLPGPLPAPLLPRSSSTTRVRRRLFLSLRLSRSIILSFSVAPPRRPSCRVHRGSCLTREYFTFPCCRNEKKRRVVPCWHQRDMKKFDFYSREAKSLFAKKGERRERNALESTDLIKTRQNAQSRPQIGEHTHGSELDF